MSWCSSQDPGPFSRAPAAPATPDAPAAPVWGCTDHRMAAHSPCSDRRGGSRRSGERFPPPIAERKMVMKVMESAWIAGALLSLAGCAHYQAVAPAASDPALFESV